MSLADIEWAAWLARPIADRKAILGKVLVAFETGSVRAGRDVMEANQLPATLSALVIPGDVRKVQCKPKNEPARDQWEPVRRMDY